MPATCLDPRTALVVIDLQHGIAAMPAAHPMTDVVRQSRQLAEAFRARGLPVVFVNVNGFAPGRTEQPGRSGALPADWAALLPELGVQPTDLRVTKRTWGAFAHTDLEKQLRAAQVTQVVLAGVATSIGVESTARQAYELGFNVTLAVDAMTDRHAQAHDNSIAHIFPRLGETDRTQSIIALLRAEPEPV